MAEQEERREREREREKRRDNGSVSTGQTEVYPLDDAGYPPSQHGVPILDAYTGVDDGIRGPQHSVPSTTIRTAECTVESSTTDHTETRTGMCTTRASRRCDCRAFQRDDDRPATGPDPDARAEPDGNADGSRELRRGYPTREGPATGAQARDARGGLDSGGSVFAGVPVVVTHVEAGGVDAARGGLHEG